MKIDVVFLCIWWLVVVLVWVVVIWLVILFGLGGCLGLVLLFGCVVVVLLVLLFVVFECMVMVVSYVDIGMCLLFVEDCIFWFYLLGGSELGVVSMVSLIGVLFIDSFVMVIFIID